MLEKWKRHLDDVGITELGYPMAMVFCEALLPGIEAMEAQDVEAYEIKTFIERCVTAVVYRDPESVARRLSLYHELKHVERKPGVPLKKPAAGKRKRPRASSGP